MKRARRAAVVVLGMHRSGTSAAMRMLNCLGVEIGDRLLPPYSGNESGFWEHRDIVEAHEALLETLGSSWHDVRPLPDGWWRDPAVAPHRQKLVAILERDFCDSPLWGFKDPRTCRLVPLWREILEETGSSPHFVITVRNPEEVARSLAKRDGFVAGKSHLLWLRHTIAIEKETRSLPRAFVTYEDLLQDWREVAGNVERALGVRWPSDPAEVADELEDFLRPELRHHRIEDRAFDDDSSLSAWLREAYAATRRATAPATATATGGKEGEVEMHRALGRISKRLGDSEALYGPVITDLMNETRARTTELAALGRRLSVAEDELERTKHDRESELAKSRQELESSRSQLSLSRAELEQAQGQLQAARDVMEQREQEVDRLGRRLGDVSRELTETRGELAETRRSLHAARAVAEAQGHQIGALTAELSAMQNRLATPPSSPGLFQRIRRDPSFVVKVAFRFLPSFVRGPLERYRDERAIRKSRLFDAAYYAKRNPELSERGVDAVEHYLADGARRGLDPGPFFDTSYYLDHNPDVAASGTNPLAHYVRRGAREGRDPGPLFDTSYYLGSNPDVARSGVNPLAHFVHHGMAEGRPCRPPDAMAALLRDPVAHPTASPCRNYFDPGEKLGPRAGGVKVGLYRSHDGAPLSREVAELVGAGLEAWGVDVVRLDDRASRPDGLTHDVIVAPHEFFYVGRGPEWSQNPMVDASILVNTEPLHTRAFTRGLPYLFRARVVADLDLHVAAALGELGIDAHFLPLGPIESTPRSGSGEKPVLPELPDVPALRSLAPSVAAFRCDRECELRNRPIDVLFAGRSSARRELFFAENARFFSRYHCFFHLSSPEDGGSELEEKEAELPPDALVGLSRRSKIQLNVHPDETRYFAWTRMVLHGMWQRTLVVTERCFDVPGLRAGEHYCSIELDEIPDALEWFLETNDGRRDAEQMRARAHDALVESYDFERVMGGFAARLLE